jgi:hypothetical protein
VGHWCKPSRRTYEPLCRNKLRNFSNESNVKVLPFGRHGANKLWGPTKIRAELAPSTSRTVTSVRKHGPVQPFESLKNILRKLTTELLRTGGTQKHIRARFGTKSVSLLRPMVSNRKGNIRRSGTQGLTISRMQARRTKFNTSLRWAGGAASWFNWGIDLFKE